MKKATEKIAATQETEQQDAPAVAPSIPDSWKDETIQITVHGAEHSVVYSFGNLSPLISKRISSLGDGQATDQQAENLISDVVLQLVESWDLTDRAGNILPVTPEGIEQLSYRTIAQIFYGILGQKEAPAAAAAAGAAGVE